MYCLFWPSEQISTNFPDLPSIRGTTEKVPGMTFLVTVEISLSVYCIVHVHQAQFMRFDARVAKRLWHNACN